MIIKKACQIYKHHLDTWGVKLKDGKVHCDDGPAVIYFDGPSKGRKEWWKNGKIHREDGSAIEFRNQHFGYFINGQYYSKIGFDNEILRKASIK